jgi:hypothetical protein
MPAAGNQRDTATEDHRALARHRPAGPDSERLPY